MRRRCVCQAPRGVSLSPGAVLMAIATVPAPTGLRLHAVGCAAFPQVHQLRVRGPQGTCSGRLQVPRTECCGEIRKWCWGGRTVLCLVRASSPGPHPSDPSSSARCSRVPRAPHTGIQTRVQTLLLHRDQGTGGCQRGGGGGQGTERGPGWPLSKWLVTCEARDRVERKGCDCPACPLQEQQSPVPGSMARGAGRAKKLGTLFSGLLECGAFCGIIFGWASLVYVLKSLGYFGQWCESSAILNPNGTLYPGMVPVSPSPSVLSSCPWCPGVPRVPPMSPLSVQVRLFVVLFGAAGSCCHPCIPAVPVSIIPTVCWLPAFPVPSAAHFPHSTHASVPCAGVPVSTNGCLADCSGQDEQFSLVFTIGSFMNNFMTLPMGYVFDRFGTAVARLIAM